MRCDAMRCDAMRCDAMGWDGMGWGLPREPDLATPGRGRVVAFADVSRRVTYRQFAGLAQQSASRGNHQCPAYYIVPPATIIHNHPILIPPTTLRPSFMVAKATLPASI